MARLGSGLAWVGYDPLGALLAAMVRRRCILEMQSLPAALQFVDSSMIPPALSSNSSDPGIAPGFLSGTVKIGNPSGASGWV